jgi:hypothetical protein
MADFTYEDFVSWDEPYGPGTGDEATGDTNWLSSILGIVSPLLGPAATAIGSLTNANRASNAAQQAGTQEASALNRGIDLQTAQWLQQQGNLAPYQEVGKQGLSALMQLGHREQPALPGMTPAVRGADYGMPSPYPPWQPRQFQRPDDVQSSQYRWNPQQGPQAADYRYTPGAIPSAAANRWTPGQGPSAQDYRYTPGQTPDAEAYRYTPGAVPTLSGAELLANDPGVAFRQDQERRALEGSAAARGDLLSGGNLKALQSRSQDLASQEYGQAWNRAASQAQMREQWGQQATAQNFGQAMSAAQLREQLQQTATQQGWSQAQTEAVFREQMAQQASQQGYAQQMSEATLREQVNQIASQQGWSQAQAEAVFREQMAQQSQAQNFNQALSAQQNAYTQGLGAEQWAQKQQQDYATQFYDRSAQQAQQSYERDRYSNEQDYTRQQADYRQRLGQFLLPWEQASTLANLGGQATGLYGTQGQNATNAISNLLGSLGQTQAQSTLGQALPKNTATNTITNTLGSLLSRLNS